MKHWQTITTNADDTMNLAEVTGRKLQGGEVVELISDLGGGKTTFVRGLAQGAGSNDHVHSPSFTISNEYSAGELKIYHFDFHRLEHPGILGEELAEILTDPKAVAVIEWADIVNDILPDLRLTIKIVPTGENSREISFEYPDELAYLIPQRQL